MTCQKTNKRIYLTRFSAERVRRNCERQRGKPLRVFACGECKGFHLTSLPFWKMASGSDAARRQIAEEQGIEIALDDNAYLHRRLTEIGEEVQDYWENLILEEFRKSLDRRVQREILKAFGL